MPQLGETVSEGTVGVWHKEVGDWVQKEEILVDIETDKTALELPAPESGILSEICIEEGQTVDVGTVLAVIDVQGHRQDLDRSITAETAEKSPTSDAATKDGVSQQPCRQEVTHLSTKRARERLSPAVRRLLEEHDLSLESIEGTGPGGRVTRTDVQRKINQFSGNSSSRSTKPGITRIPFDRIRAITAEHMVRSKSTSPHVLQAIEVDFSAVEEIRRSLGSTWRSKKGYAMTYLPFIAKAVAIAISDFPKVNASIEQDTLLVHDAVNLAIAVDLSFAGLVAPVIHNCAVLSAGEIAEKIRDLSLRARNGQLRPDEVHGGTYTISNSGAFGTFITAPIINQPQVAILSTDGIKKRVVVVENGDGDEMVIRPTGLLAQSFDHRAFDGAYSATFLNRVKELIVHHDWSSEFAAL